MAFRGSFQGQFNYHEQIPHGWDFQYADSSQGQFNYHAQFCQPYRPIIPNPSVAPFRHPQPRAYCEICDVELPNHKCWEIHNKGRKHRSKLRQKASNGQESSQIPNSQMNLVVPPKTVLESKKSKCHVENVSSQATVFKYKNFQQKDNTSGNGHGFKRKFVGETVGKHIKMNNGIKRLMEPSNLDVSALSNSAEYLVQKPTLTPPPGPASPITAPISVGGSSLKLQFQHVSASQTQVSEGKEHHDRIPQPYRPTIPSPSAAPFRHTQSRVYCEICDLELSSDKCWKTHNRGRKHQSKLRQKASNGLESSQIPNSQMNSVFQPKTVMESKKSKCHVENVSSQATISKHKNFQQKDTGISSKIPAEGCEGKPKDNTSGNCSGFKHDFGGDRAGKYMKTNNGMKRPMESSKPDVSALSNSAEYLVQKPALTPLPWPALPIIAPTCVGGSSLKLQFQHVSTSQTQVSEGKEHHGIQILTVDSDVSTMTEDMCSVSAALAIAASPKGHIASQVHAPPPAPGLSFEPENQHGLQKEVLKGKEQHEIQNHTVKITDQPQSISVEVHAPSVSNINNQTENMNSDSSAIAIAIAGPMASQVPIPPQAMGSSFEPQIESRNYESLNSTGKTNIQLLPLVLMEFDAPSGVRTNTKTADESSKAKAKVMVCLKCGAEGFSDTFVFCDKCQVYALHRYCLDGPVNFYDDVTWLCEDCEPHVIEKSFHYQCILPSRVSDSSNSAKDASQGKSDVTNYVESVKDNNNQQQNIAAKRNVMLSDCHSVSNHAQSQSINNYEEEEKLKEDCQSVPIVEDNSSEGFVTVHDPYPIVDPTWRGSWCFSNQSSDTFTGLFAHLSTLACPKVLEETRLFPEVLSANLLPRSAVWPKGFLESGPNDESIALYFFPESESVERAYDNLVDDMISHDLAIKAMIKNAELLVFPSTVLPIKHRRFQAKYYLWGVFRAKQAVLISP